MMTLFMELAKPNPETGESRWVQVSEFTSKICRFSFGQWLELGQEKFLIAEKI